MPGFFQIVHCPSHNASAATIRGRHIGIAGTSMRISKTWKQSVWIIKLGRSLQMNDFNMEIRSLSLKLSILSTSK